jgi:hypothetical protein
VEHLREYQDYLLAYRLRVLIGGRLNPKTKVLNLSEYAQKRLERQELAKRLLATPNYHQQLRHVEDLTDAINFGFWHNPGETIQVLKRVIEQGGCKALESSGAFTEALLTRREKETLSSSEQDLVARYYLGLFRASAAYLDAEVFTRLRGELEPLREMLPVFVLPGEIKSIY